jgi:predicted nucleic acid-binding Zn ribbon protein
MENHFLEKLSGSIGNENEKRECSVCGKPLKNKLNTFCSRKCRNTRIKEWRCLECGAKIEKERVYCLSCKQARRKVIETSKINSKCVRSLFKCMRCGRSIKRSKSLCSICKKKRTKNKYVVIT